MCVLMTLTLTVYCNCCTAPRKWNAVLLTFCLAVCLYEDAFILYKTAIHKHFLSL
jgi:hypothetical protein